MPEPAPLFFKFFILKYDFGAVKLSRLSRNGLQMLLTVRNLIQLRLEQEKNKTSLFGISLKCTASKLCGHLYHSVFLAFRPLS